MKQPLQITSEQDYRVTYQYSIANRQQFWEDAARQLKWSKPFTQIEQVSFQPDNVSIKWFADGELNVAVNCIDRHLPHRKDKTAIIWEPNQPDAEPLSISYKDLYENVARLANGLEQMGVKPSDRVVIYMPMIPELAYACLACSRIGAIHSVVFGGFSAQSLAGRIDDCEAKWVITATAGVRGSKIVPLQSIVANALNLTAKNSVVNTLVVNYLASEQTDTIENAIDYHSLVADQAAVHHANSFNAEHPLFILYTSGSTGKPKGLQHSSAGYLTYVATTQQQVFDLKEDDIFWCTADIGWITGHSYLLYGPLANGCTTLMFEGVPNYPDLARFGQIIDRHKVSIFYTAPTAIRTLLADATVALNSRRTSLRILGTVGEPINPEVWRWYFDSFGLKQCKVVDTWWQTETGGHLITPLPHTKKPKPGCAMQPFFGIEPALIDDSNSTVEGEGSGHLVIKNSWPGQARTIWGDHKRFEKTYFSQHPWHYFSGDGAKRDADGNYWITGRVDDVLNVSGHRLGTAEIESAAVSLDTIAEAAVVGYPHPVKGEGIYVYATPNVGVVGDDNLKKALIVAVRTQVGPVATPDVVQWCTGLPKTRSGKIMRRILRKIAANDFDNLGDISTLADPHIVAHLIKNK